MALALNFISRGVILQLATMLSVTALGLKHMVASMMMTNRYATTAAVAERHKCPHSQNHFQIERAQFLCVEAIRAIAVGPTLMLVQLRTTVALVGHVVVWNRDHFVSWDTVACLEVFSLLHITTKSLTSQFPYRWLTMTLNMTHILYGGMFTEAMSVVNLMHGASL